MFKNGLIMETLPIHDIRRTYPKILEELPSLMNAVEIESALKPIIVDAETFELVIAAREGTNPFGPTYNEIRGLGE